jgi:hypothetical protein
MEERIKEVITDRYIVRINYGKLSDEELRKTLEEACISFAKALRKSGKEGEIPCSTQIIPKETSCDGMPSSMMS